VEIGRNGLGILGVNHLSSNYFIHLSSIYLHFVHFATSH
jgi:hypothetical protein